MTYVNKLNNECLNRSNTHFVKWTNCSDSSGKCVYVIDEGYFLCQDCEKNLLEYPRRLVI